MPLPALALAVLSFVATADDEVSFFESRIRPILSDRCEKCHGPAKQKGGLRLDTKEGWSRGGDRGPAIVPGKPDESYVIQAVRHTDDLEMPPKPTSKLSDREIADLTDWVKRGAADPRIGSAKLGGMSFEDAKKWWSLQPIRRPNPPISSAGQHPIDAFLDSEIKSAGVRAAPKADKRTLIRRATYDLTGLPPTREEVDAFLNDELPEAFPKVVDRLLASRHYGERWGRHWLDLVRYADTAGENTDHPLPHMWKYRNWVISAFNSDLPFNDFVRYQIAGDLLTKDVDKAEAADRTVATGYLAVARRFGHDIDKDIHLTIEDTIDTTSKSILGLTVGCARCHNHKYDPVSTEDYYALYGIFSSTRLPFPGCEPKPLPANLVTLPTGEPAYAVAEGTSADAKMQLRGDPEKLGPVVPRRWLEALGGERVPQGEGSGRVALAKWLSDNPLTPRVIVNRVWLGHFGKGIVRTPSDFGSRGLPPTNPELLDWLASDFLKSGQSFKALHRRIMTSEAYQRACGQPADEDPDNKLQARFERRRLSADELRDTLLVASDRLDRTPGGPHPFPPEKDWHYTQHDPFAAFYPSDKRSVYLIVTRNRRDPFFSLFDGADPNASTPFRQDTTVPTQALYFLNSKFVHECSEQIVKRVNDEPNDASKLDRLVSILYQRPATEAERMKAERFLQSYRSDLAEDERAHAPWAALTRVLISSNEFLYLD